MISLDIGKRSPCYQVYEDEERTQEQLIKAIDSLLDKIIFGKDLSKKLCAELMHFFVKDYSSFIIAHRSYCDEKLDVKVVDLLRKNTTIGKIFQKSMVKSIDQEKKNPANQIILEAKMANIFMKYDFN